MTRSDDRALGSASPSNGSECGTLCSTASFRVLVLLLVLRLLRLLRLLLLLGLP
jgi:hypothetical protein